MQAATELPFPAERTARAGVVETFTLSKWGAYYADLNEDGVFANHAFAAAVDGISDHYGQRYRRGTSGRIAMTVVLGTLATLRFDADEEAFREQATLALARTFGPGQPGERRPGVAMVVYSHHWRELWSYADPIALAFDGHGKTVLAFGGDPGGGAAARERVRLNQELLAQGAITPDSLYRQDPGLDSADVKTLLTGPSPRLNTPGGVAVLNGTVLPEGCTVNIRPVPDDAAMLVLATDGYPRHLMEDADFWNLERAERRLAEINASDPHCLGINAGVKGIMDHPETRQRGNSYDDRSYLRIRL